MRRYLGLIFAIALLSTAAVLGVRHVGAVPGQARAAATQPTAAGAKPAAHPSRTLVTRAQRVLITEGRLKGKADGKMSPATRSAIRAYQKQKGLKITGTLSAETLARMGLAPDSTVAHAQAK